MVRKALALLPENVSSCIIRCSIMTKMTQMTKKGGEKDVSKRMGTEGASEILQESVVIGEKSGVVKKSGGKDESGATKDAQVMGEGSEGVGEGSGGG